MRTLLSLVILSCMTSLCVAQQNNTVVTNVSVSEFKHLLDSLQDEVVVDLRTPEEVRQGKVPGSIVIDFFGADFEPSVKALDKNKVYLLYCASGGRSGETSELMHKMGFRNIYNLETGFTGWSKSRMPIVKK